MFTTMNLKPGMKVGIKTFDGAYEGIIHVVDEENGKFSLKKIVNSDTGKKRHGLLFFFEHEISHIEILDSKENKSEKLVDEKILEKSQNEDLVSPSVDPFEEELCEQGAAAKKSTENSPEKPVLRQTIPEDEDHDVVIIDRLDGNFYKAIFYIEEEKEIGLSMEGVNLGRYGRVCWMQIATRDYVFLFDLIDLAEEFIQNGLKAILQNPSITKIIHDCRRISDALHHKFETKLVNVYDTQVADVLVYKLLNSGDMPRYVRNLTSCLTDHLKLVSSNITFPHMDEGCWKQRPLPSQLVDAAVKKVVHLKRLKAALTEKLNTELKAGIELYLAANRDAKSEEIATASPHLLPQSFQKMLSHSLKKKAANGLMMQNNEVYFDCYGFRTNNIHIGNPNLLFTRDSWHQFDKLQSNKNVFSSPPKRRPVRNEVEVSPALMPEEKSPSSPPKKNLIPSSTPPKTPSPVKSISKKNEIKDDKCNAEEENIWEKIRKESKDKQETPKLNIKPAGFRETCVRKKYLKLNNENQTPDLGNDKKSGKGRGLFSPELLDRLNAMNT